MSEENVKKDEAEEIEENEEWDAGWDEIKSTKEIWSFEGTQSWAWGASLILIGVLFLLDNFGITNMRTYNWWAVFILAPGLSMLSRAYSLYSENEMFTSGSRKNGIFGLVLVLVALSFLFGIGFGFIWPILLISVGIYLLFSNR